MFAQVYTIARLPRRLGVFDYAIPDNLSINIGDLVEVPFKGRPVYGIVRRIVEVAAVEKPQPLLRFVATKFVDETYLEVVEKIAEPLDQSPSAMLLTAFGRSLESGSTVSVKASEQPTVPRELIDDVRRYAAEVQKQNHLAVADTFEAGLVLAKALRTQIKGQLLILTPVERDAELVSRFVDFGPSTVLMHGKIPERKRGAIIRAWRDGNIRTLIATRQASLLPPHDLEATVVLHAGNDEYFNRRRNPHFDAREALQSLSTAKIVWVDDLPRLEETLSRELTLPARSIASPKIVNLTAPEERSAHPHLGVSLLAEVKNALQSQKKVLLCYNRKGVAKRLQCAGCEYLPTCGTCGHPPVLRVQDLVCPACGTEMWYPKTCPSCGQPKLKLRGLGKTNIVQTLRKEFPGIAIAELEKGMAWDPNAKIIVTTEYFFSSVLKPFAPKSFGLVADLAADLPLFADDFRSEENALRKFLRLRNFAAAQGAVALVQTWMPEVFEKATNLQKFYQTENESRQRYHLPPYGQGQNPPRPQES